MDSYGSPNYRNLVVGVDDKVTLANGYTFTPINFDNASTTPPLQNVLAELVSFAPNYGSVHRGNGIKAEISEHNFASARNLILDFVKADRKTNTVIFVKNTTEGINKLSYRLLKPGGKAVVLSTSMEHHSNDLPWRNKYQVEYVAVDSRGRLELNDLEAKLRKYKGACKLVTVTGASNVTGYLNPIHTIAELAHNYGAKLHVDGAQLVPHCPVDVKPDNSAHHIDFLTFSAHKMYAPFGTGVLIGPKATFEKGNPEYPGGGTVETVTRKRVTWNTPPYKDEAGTPNLMGAVALSAAVKTLQQIGMATVYNHEYNLAVYALQQLHKVPGIKLYTWHQPGEPHLGIIPFNLEGLTHATTAQFLAQSAGIAVRNGCFCAQPYVRKLLGINPETTLHGENLPGMVRISFALYNNYREIDILVRSLIQLAAKCR